jgi:hypothetical protein
MPTAPAARRSLAAREDKPGHRRRGDQVIRENPASRGTETSAEELVGLPWRMVSNAGQQQWYGHRFFFANPTLKSPYFTY